VHGADDPLVPVTGTRSGIEHLGGAQVVEKVYPGARHEVFNETNADDVLADVTSFLDRVLPATRTTAG
jgi:alpha-beta hydrolase superfamily lysophospholipase